MKIVLEAGVNDTCNVARRKARIPPHHVVEPTGLASDAVGLIPFFFAFSFDAREDAGVLQQYTTPAIPSMAKRYHKGLHEPGLRRKFEHLYAYSFTNRHTPHCRLV